MKKYIIIFILFFLQNSFAQDLSQGYIADDLVQHPMQDLSKPAYLECVTDPSFPNTTIRRITEATPGNFIVPMYSTVQAWNSDESLLIVYGGGTHKLLNGTDYTFIRDLTAINPDDIEAVFWHFNNPDILFYMDNTSSELVSYNVSTDVKTTIVNLRTLTGCSPSEGMSSGNDLQMMSWDSDVFGFRCGNTATYYYKISTGTLTQFNIANVNYTAAMPFPSGNLFYHNKSVYDSAGNFVRTFNIDKVEHSCLGKLSNGDDALFEIAFEEGPSGGCQGTLVAHNATTGNCMSVTPPDDYGYPKSGTHISALAHKNTEGGWVAVSSLGFQKDGVQILDQELFIAKVNEFDASVYRVAHHRSDADDISYWGEPHVTISPTGTRLLYGSDWSGVEDGISVDSYVAELHAYSDFAVWTASGWDISPQVPTSKTKVTIMADYDTSVVGANIDAGQLTIDAGAVVTVAAGDYIRVACDMKVDGTLNVEHQGSVVQLSNSALMTNNGTINVNITTPLLKPRDFMVIGNPLSAAVPVGVDNPIFRKIKQTTTDFRPHPEVQTMFPGGSNFVDEDFNDWSFHTGNFNPGEGYYLYPQASLADGNKTYNLTYQGGSLNNGVITYDLDYNTTGTGTGDATMNKNASPNIISNPYASAISANDFLEANDAVDELYFWEHNTTPNTSFPGANTANFNMADISTQNATGFNPASTGSTTLPTSGDFSIATAQGFGIKNNGATTGTGQTATFNNTMRRVDNNNTLRASENNDHIWLSINSDAYSLSSSTLIGFTNKATQLFDQGFDSERLGVPVSLYSHLPDGTAALGIQGREAFVSNTEISLGFSSQIDAETEYSISILKITGGSITNVDTYLRDNLTGVLHNISEEKYFFTSEKGTFNNRFTLLFKDRNVLGVDTDLLSDIKIYPNPAGDIINLKMPNDTTLETVTIYDIMGRAVKQISVSSIKPNNTISVSDLANASYFVTIQTNKGQITKQLIKR